jgi:hypothetical protein
MTIGKGALKIGWQYLLSMIKLNDDSLSFDFE